MADHKTTRRPKGTPPAVGKTLTVRVTDEGMRDDLAVIMRTGCDASDAVRQALLLLANVCDGAWRSGATPPGIVPTITTALVTPHRPSDTPDQHV